MKHVQAQADAAGDFKCKWFNHAVADAEQECDSGKENAFHQVDV